MPSARRADTAGNANNSSRLRGQGPRQLKTRWLLLDEQGEIEDQSGGFTVVDGYETNSNAYIDAGEGLSDNGFSATIAIQNQIMGGNVNGEISVSRCNIPGVVICAPPGTNNNNTLVVSPRNSDGTAAAAPGSGSSTKRLYVTVTESATEYTEGL